MAKDGKAPKSYTYSTSGFEFNVFLRWLRFFYAGLFASLTSLIWVVGYKFKLDPDEERRDTIITSELFWMSIVRRRKPMGSA